VEALAAVKALKDGVTEVLHAGVTLAELHLLLPALRGNETNPLITKICKLQVFITLHFVLRRTF
jgi:hypothetical protein